MTNFMCVLLAVPLVFGVVAWRAFVFAALWGWLIVPAFGMAPIGMREALLVLLLAAFFGRPARKKDSGGNWEEFFTDVIFSFLFAAMLLGSGWVVKQWL